MARFAGADYSSVDRTHRLAAAAALTIALLVYAHDALPYLTMMPRVNVDEPWLMERAYQIMLSGTPRQPMYGLDEKAYLLQTGYPYLLSGWMTAFGVGLRQARLLAVVLGFGTLLMVAALGRHLLRPLAGAAAALFLAADSNFLGTARNARTDMPAVFFAASALACYAVGRDKSSAAWWWLCGISAGLAMMCHGNAIWVGVILALWLLIDLGPRMITAPRTYAIAAGGLLTLTPYLAVIATHFDEVRHQVATFVPERVPFASPARIAAEVVKEAERYRTWYFGLVTNSVPNPLLWVFQLVVVVGLVIVAWRVARGGRRGQGDALVLTLAVGSAAIFAAFINNKVPVYMPHLLIGFSLLAGAAVDGVAEGIARATSASLARPRPLVATALVAVFVAGYGAAATAYYEKWYSSVRKSELVPYERTAATLRALVPAGPKNLYGSPHFWPPFHAEPDTVFRSYALGAERVRTNRPVHLLVDESQWLPDMRAVGQETFRRSWTAFIEERCTIEAIALGTAYGTIAEYVCGLEKPVAKQPLIVGGTTIYRVSDRVADFAAADLARWPRYEDPRRRPGNRPEVVLASRTLRISGTGWPGIVLDYPATIGDRYLVRVAADGAHDGDLLYLGTWQHPQVLSLAGAASAGMPTPLAHEPWFPGDRAFVATADRVPIAIYSEAPDTDFTVSSVEIYRLRPSPYGEP